MGQWELPSCCPSPLAGRWGPASVPHLHEAREGRGGPSGRGQHPSPTTVEPRYLHLSRSFGCHLYSNRQGKATPASPLSPWHLRLLLPPLPGFPAGLVTNLGPGIPRRHTPPTWELAIFHRGNRSSWGLGSPEASHRCAGLRSPKRSPSRGGYGCPCLPPGSAA